MHSFRSVPCLLEDESVVARRCPSQDLLAPARHDVTSKMARKKRSRAQHAPAAGAQLGRSRCQSNCVMTSVGVEVPVREPRRRRKDPIYEVSCVGDGVWSPLSRTSTLRGYMHVHVISLWCSVHGGVVKLSRWQCSLVTHLTKSVGPENIMRSRKNITSLYYFTV